MGGGGEEGRDLGRIQYALGLITPAVHALSLPPSVSLLFYISSTLFIVPFASAYNYAGKACIKKSSLCQDSAEVELCLQVQVLEKLIRSKPE